LILLSPLLPLDPKVSIVIPVFNGSDFLREAIESALNQTYRHIEVIVVNDGSTDGGATEDIAKSYGDAIRYFRKDNGGVATALNAGIGAMTGDYFSWLSHDDLYVPHKVERQVSILKRLGEPKTVLFSDYVNVDAANHELYEVRMDHDLLSKKPLYAVFKGALHGCTLLIPRKALLDVGSFNDLRTTQDYDLWFRLIRKYRFRHIPEVLVRSRLHPGQASRSIDATEEADRLWIRMMSELTPEEIVTLESSEKLFFRQIACFFAPTPYRKAYAFARKRAGFFFISSRIRIIERIRRPARVMLSAVGLLAYLRFIRKIIETFDFRGTLRGMMKVIALEKQQRIRDRRLLDGLKRILDKVDPSLRR
jgi:hypothetical protein